MSPTPAHAPVFLIGGHSSQGAPVPPDLGGSKAANLSRLERLGLRVPPAVVLSTTFCRDYLERGTVETDFHQQLQGHVRQLEEATGLRLGGRRPLIVSVRSSPPVSMPGMLETVLNVGLTEAAVRAMIRSTGNYRLAWDGYRRLMLDFATTVFAVPHDALDRLSAQYVAEAQVQGVQDLDPLELRALARATADLLESSTGQTVPLDPLTQVAQAVEAVWRSWTSFRAREYRRLNGLDSTTGTGVLIQTMVFGNAGGASGSGVGFTRDPTDGRDQIYVDFLCNAQGQDIVSGRQTHSDAARLPAVLPGVHAELEQAKRRLESEFGDMQDFEFTVQDGQLYFLQTRTGKRTPWAALQIAVDLVSAGLIDSQTALRRLSAVDLEAVKRTRLDPRSGEVPIATGVAAGLGVAAGAIAFDSATAQRMASQQPVILVRSEMSPNDIAGLEVAAGVLTALGGRTSHAAVVARQMGKVCVVGCRALRLDGLLRQCSIGDQTFREGELITIDGETGHIYRGRVAVVIETPREALAAVARWRQHA
jgi:pyruvate,orthophosphate dikinase